MNILTTFFLNFKSSLSSANDVIVTNVVAFEDYWIGTVLNIIRLIGTGVALIAITVMSIAYFTADRKIISRCYRKEGTY